MKTTGTRLEDAVTVGARMGVRPSTVLIWARRRKIPSVRLSRKVVRFSWPDVLAAVRNEAGSARSRGRS